MGGLSHLVQRGGAWAGWISVLLYNGPLLCGFNVPVKGLKSLKTVWLVQSAVSVCVGYVYDLCRTGFLPSYLYAICGDDYSRSGGVRDYADNYSWTRTHVSYIDTETNFKVCLISVGIAGWVGGVQPSLNIFKPPSCACLFILGVRCNPHRSHLQTLAIFMSHKMSKILHFLVNTWVFLKLRMHQNPFSAGAPPRTPLRELMSYDAPPDSSRLGSGTPLPILLPVDAPSASLSRRLRPSAHYFWPPPNHNHNHKFNQLTQRATSGLQ